MIFAIECTEHCARLQTIQCQNHHQIRMRMFCRKTYWMAYLVYDHIRPFNTTAPSYFTSNIQNFYVRTPNSKHKFYKHIKIKTVLFNHCCKLTGHKTQKFAQITNERKYDVCIANLWADRVASCRGLRRKRTGRARRPRAQTARPTTDHSR